MSYGLLIENASGGLVFSDRRVMPWFAGKLSASGAWDGPETIPLFGTHEIYRRTFSTGGLPGGSYMLAITLPQVGEDVWVGLDYYSTGGSSSVLMTIASNAGEPVLPEIFAFGISPPPATGDAYGLRVWDESGQLVFDSGHLPLSLVASPAVTPGGGPVGLAALSKHVLIPFPYEKVLWEGDPGFLTSKGKTTQLLYRRPTANAVECQMVLTKMQYEDAFLEDIEERGSPASQSVMVLNGASYE